ncbi:unnamed protein product [Closterium sp. NIES-54]
MWLAFLLGVPDLTTRCGHQTSKENHLCASMQRSSRFARRWSLFRPFTVSAAWLQRGVLRVGTMSGGAATILPAESTPRVIPGIAGGQSNGPSTSRSAGKGRRRRAAAEMRRIEQQRWGEALVAPDDDASSDVSPSPTEAARVSLMQQTASARRRQQRRVSRRQLREGQREIEEFFEREGEQDGEEEWRWGYGGSSSSNSVRGRSRGQQTSSSVPWSHFGGFADGDELEMALALSLSLVDHPIAASDSTGSLSDAAAAAASGDLSYEAVQHMPGRVRGGRRLAGTALSAPIPPTLCNRVAITVLQALPCLQS